MAPEHGPSVSDPTRAAWVDRLRPAAERALVGIWRPTYQFALLDAGLRRTDRHGRRSLGAGLETRRARVAAFYDLRYRLSVGLAGCTIDVVAARATVANSEFASQLWLAASRAEAADQLAALLVGGYTSLSDSDFQGVVLWVTAGRD